MSNTQTVYRYDAKGYYIGTSLAQFLNNELLLPSDCTKEKPTFKGGYWSKFNGKKWELEKIPASCAECIEQEFTCISNSPDRHEQEKKAVIESLVNADSENYKTVVSDDFVMLIEEIPEPTEEEKQQKEDEEKQQTLDRANDELIKEMAQADLMGDEDWKAELRDQYQALINGDEE